MVLRLREKWAKDRPHPEPAAGPRWGLFQGTGASERSKPKAVLIRCREARRGGGENTLLKCASKVCLLFEQCHYCDTPSSPRRVRSSSACPAVGKWKSKVCCVQMVGYDSFFKRKGV